MMEAGGRGGAEDDTGGAQLGERGFEGRGCGEAARVKKVSYPKHSFSNSLPPSPPRRRRRARIAGELPPLHGLSLPPCAQIRRAPPATLPAKLRPLPSPASSARLPPRLAVVVGPASPARSPLYVLPPSLHADSRERHPPPSLPSSAHFPPRRAPLASFPTSSSSPGPPHRRDPPCTASLPPYA
ncbi:lysine-rich arabinogalactan protein 19-like [Miscanthus floridulus]|uniref:lysine-rich arabinogalactan protein 19-like n=1 Tax=Miscanthus floridulus TaxID=154761 RepID=UPI003457468F